MADLAVRLRPVCVFSTGFAFDVFPNGRQFLMLRGGSTQPQLSVVVNWPGLAQTRGAAADR